ncbi:MAG: cytochrome ubiquinol oxidase subunit I [Ottowia sp.]|nr:cytochrome ubiquinol oxidase subunit I [Ottowia sp.]
MDLDIVGISRLQFAMTALYHFIFVPMTLGLSILVAVMETIYVATRRPVWRQITKFFGVLFGINFAVGVGTGLVMEFQFGMNWSYYSHYMGDIFGAPLAFEALMAFFLEATLVGMFYFGWDRITTKQHLLVTWGMAVGTNLSAMWILIANGWMQFPTAATINPYTMRMEMASVVGVIFSPVAQAKFLHVVTAGYTYAALFVIGVCSWFLLKKRHQEMSRRAIAAAAAFGLVGSISLIIMGDVSGIHVAEKQPMKMATIEGIWETEPAPAPFTVIAFPDQQARENHFAIKIPAVLGLISTHSTSKEIPGVKELIEQAQARVRNGIVAYDTMMQIQEYGKARQDAPAELLNRWNDTYKDLGYALLLKRYVDDPRTASDAQIMQAADDTLPVVWPLFWSFRIMVGLGFFFFALIAAFFYHAVKGCKFEDHPLLLRLAVWAIPLPVVACEMGWFVAEYGRQPWAVEGALPVAIAVSNLSAAAVLATVLGFIAIYTVLLVIMLKLMFRTVRKGPDPRELQPLPGDISMPGLSAASNA